MYEEFLSKMVNKLSGKDITILPHDNIDVDSAISCILLSKLFCFLNINNSIAIFDDKIPKDTEKILSKLGYDLNDFIVNNEDSSRNLFLVDHYSTRHNGDVNGIIDHHFTNDNIHVELYLYNQSSAAAYIIFKLMLDSKMPIDMHIVELLTYAVLVDTCVFKSSKTVEEEKLYLDKLVSKYNLNYGQIKEDSLMLTDVQNMCVDDIVNNGRKNYAFNDHYVSSSYIQLNDEIVSNLKEQILKSISYKVKKDNIDMWVLIVYNVQLDITYVYYISKFQVKEKTYNYYASRGDDIIPGVQEYFESN